MTEFSNDDSRLRAAEEQMRRALGLRDSGPAAPQAPPVARQVQAPNGAHRPHRRFVREGEVPVEVVHHEGGGGTNQLEAARQAIRALTTVREQTERQLAEAHGTIRDLQTKLAHERIARDEAVRRAAAEGEDTEKALHSARVELEEERAARRATEEQLAAALTRRSDIEQRAAPPKQPALALEEVGSGGARSNDAELTDQAAKPGRRRGRPPKTRASEPEPDFVEWWKPGWQKQFR
jgi:hypothetical protein